MLKLRHVDVARETLRETVTARCNGAAKACEALWPFWPHRCSFSRTKLRLVTAARSCLSVIARAAIGALPARCREARCPCRDKAPCMHGSEPQGAGCGRCTHTPVVCTGCQMTAGGHEARLAWSGQTFFYPLLKLSQNINADHRQIPSVERCRLRNRKFYNNVIIIISAYWVIEYCRYLVRSMGRTDRPGVLTSRSAVEGGVDYRPRNRVLETRPFFGARD